MTITPLKSPAQRKVEADIQNTAQFIYSAIKALPTPRDGATALALANTALIWSQRPATEQEVRELMRETTEVVVTMWKAQAAGHAENERGK